MSDHVLVSISGSLSRVDIQFHLQPASLRRTDQFEPMQQHSRSAAAGAVYRTLMLTPIAQAVFHGMPGERRTVAFIVPAEKLDDIRSTGRIQVTTPGQWSK
jgi:hypothetical protein